MRSIGSITFAVFCLLVVISLADARRPSKGRPYPSHGKGKPYPSHGKGKGKPGKGKGKPKPPTRPATTTAVPSGSCTCDVEAIKGQVLASVDATILSLTSQLENATAQIRNIAEPDVFSCKRMSGFSEEDVSVPYTLCDVEKPSGLVDLDSGKFTVQRDGVYRMTFTSRMSAMNGKIIRADMYVNGVRIARASANLDTFDTQTNTSSTTILDLETTNTLDLLYEMKAGDEVYMMIDYVGTTSLIQSSSNYQIFFTGEWIRA